ncbi:aminoglycoside phosphotransferase family protein [Actinomadura barringtoniae]|uniref:Aminoglycoside phosphotransferase family protein n=1 Tax=Actinomadura barringtoniae TaxID=1427535 RepID=A0A939T7E7_9ACTN|nr:aminoglycoside phosphotransferase family protein [Actinomadura barringtoniae]MBO2453038.1 aminoglycoside phosphotransferase family protein [Actinomadura barringtoniae]
MASTVSPYRGTDCNPSDVEIEVGSARQRREIALRDLIRPHLPIAVPGSVATGEWSPGLTYTLDTRLPGRSAELRAISAAGERDLTALLEALRSVPLDAARALDLDEPPPRNLEALGALTLGAAALLGGDAPLDPDAGPQGTPDRPPVLLHNDLKGEHLLVDEAGRVSGVLDWTDAAVGDPAEDVAGLAISVGAEAAARVAAAYGPEVVARGLFLARCDTLIRLSERLLGEDDSPLELLHVQRERAWETPP